MMNRSALIIVAVLAIAMPVMAQHSVWIPIVAHLPGVGASLWRTDIGILNECGEPVTVELVLHRAGGEISRSFTVDSREHLQLRDVVAQLVAEDTIGSLEIRSDGPVSVTSKTSNHTLDGIFGQSLPSIEVGVGVLVEGEGASLQHLSETAAYRTNLGVLNAGSTPAVISIALFDSQGEFLGSFKRTVGARRVFQDVAPFRARFARTNIDGGWAEISVISGSGVWAFASVVNNGTGDPTTIEMKERNCSSGEFPVADFAWTQDAPAAGQALQFSDASTELPVAWLWNFGDGFSSQGQHPVHTYAAEGSYEVTLSVYNGAGSDSTTRSLTVTGSGGGGCDAPEAPTISAPGERCSGLPYEVNWTATSTDDLYQLQESKDQLFVSGESFDLTEPRKDFRHTESAETAYYYRARAGAHCGDGTMAWSAWSEVVQTTVASEENCTETITLPGGVTMELIHVPAGAFMMGTATDARGRELDEDLHEVTLTQGYFLSKYEVTQAQWEAVMGENPAVNWGVGDNHPVHSVSWNDVCRWTTEDACAAESFIGRLNAYLGTTKFRLPTEAEWEYAARAGTETEFSFDVTANPEWDVACGPFPEAEPSMWWCGNSDVEEVRPVGSKLPNPWGLYDMHGSLQEWVFDWYTSAYGNDPLTDPTGPETGTHRVLRSGSWFGEARFCRSADRDGLPQHHSAGTIGFRLAKSE
ncbi:MAG: SUMF1/EgtB/PvdO family nonheme iron enzyme [Acidobacteriota bacterium]